MTSFPVFNQRLLAGLAFSLASSCVYAQTAPSPANVGISKGNPDTFKLLDSSKNWTPFGTVSPSTHIFVPATNGAIAPNDCVKWGPGLTSAGAACNSVTGGATPANQLTIYTSHSGLANNVTTPTEAWTVMQQGFYAPGDGGEATYTWNFTSYCPLGTSGAPTKADGLSCILPIGQSASTAGRYLLNLANGNMNVRQFGMQPGGQDNSPFVQPMMTAIYSAMTFGITGPDIVFPVTLGQRYTIYNFTEPFTVTHGVTIRCSGGGGTTKEGSMIQLIFPAGVDGIQQEIAASAPDGVSSGGSKIEGCTIASVGKWLRTANVGADTGSHIITGMAAVPPQPYSASQVPMIAPGDGLAVISSLEPINGNVLVHPGAYVSAVSGNQSNASITLAQTSDGAPRNYVLGQQGGGVHSAAAWDLPASETYTINATAGSPLATITGGRRPIKVGTLIWTDPFVYGAMTNWVDNEATTATVNSGGSGYVGTSGTMTWTGLGCDGWPLVLNVTASSGVITGVTSIASSGPCNAVWPPSTATTWTPGGGLSGGTTPASFNLAFTNSVRITTVVGWAHPSNALESGTYKLWTLSAGIMRRTVGYTHGVRMEEFPIGMELVCDGGTRQSTGCSGSADDHSSYAQALIGRLVMGDNSDPSTSMGDEFDINSTADIVDVASLSNTYINDNGNSTESNTDSYSALGYCGSLNYSLFIGGYFAGNASDNGYCIANDVNGDPNIGAGIVLAEGGVAAQGSFLSIASGAAYGAASIFSGQISGRWENTGYGVMIFTTTHATPSGSFVTFDSGQIPANFFAGMAITDLTTTAAIPGGTTVTAITSTGVYVSNPVAGGGVLANDVLQFSTPGSAIAGCIVAEGGLELTWSMQPICDNNGLYIGYDGYINGVDFQYLAGGNARSRLVFPAPNYLGYNGVESVVAPWGIALGSLIGGGVGRERIIDMGQSGRWQVPLDGDVQFTTVPSTGSSMGWTEVYTATATLSAPIVSGTTTSVAVSACPSPAPVVGALITSTLQVNTAGGDNEFPIGSFASCSGTGPFTLTFQAAATSSAASGGVIKFLATVSMPHVSNDPGGYNHPAAKLTDVATLLANAPCSGNSTVGIGMVSNGQAVGAAGYNATVSTTGSTVRLVFCDGTSWTYH